MAIQRSVNGAFARNSFASSFRERKAVPVATWGCPCCDLIGLQSYLVASALAGQRLPWMENADTSSAHRYHESTKHSEFTVRMSGHVLDWGNRPHPFKVYEELPAVPLPRGFPIPEADALQAVSSAEARYQRKSIRLGDLA